MPRGPNGQKRPADVIGAAIMVAQLATGQITETLEKKSGRTRSGHAGAAARSASLTKARRKSIARKAAEARWGHRDD